MRHVKRYLATYTLPKKNQWDMLYTVYKVNHVNKFSWISLEEKHYYFLEGIKQQYDTKYIEKSLNVFTP